MVELHLPLIQNKTCLKMVVNVLLLVPFNRFLFRSSSALSLLFPCKQCFVKMLQHRKTSLSMYSKPASIGVTNKIRTIEGIKLPWQVENEHCFKGIISLKWLFLQLLKNESTTVLVYSPTDSVYQLLLVISNFTFKYVSSISNRFTYKLSPLL